MIWRQALSLIKMEKGEQASLALILSHVFRVFVLSYIVTFLETI